MTWCDGCRAKEAITHQHQYRAMCSGLAAQNALLKSQLFAVVKALRRERAASQAELQNLRQKARSSLATPMSSLLHVTAADSGQGAMC